MFSAGQTKINSFPKEVVGSSSSSKTTPTVTKQHRQLRTKRAAWQQLVCAHHTTLPTFAVQFAFLPQIVSHAAVGCATVHELQQNEQLLQSGWLTQEALFALIRAGLAQKLFDEEDMMEIAEGGHRSSWGAQSHSNAVDWLRELVQ